MPEQAKTDAAVVDVLHKVIDNAAVGTVFGTPINQDGVTLLPVARVSAGGGGGNGNEPRDNGEEAGGSGGGMGVAAKPMGVYVIADGKVSWRPAVDVNKVIMGGQIVMAIALLTLRVYLKTRHRTHRH
jgi:uncharacterized spore protein YtfJ